MLIDDVDKKQPFVNLAPNVDHSSLQQACCGPVISLKLEPNSVSQPLSGLASNSSFIISDTTLAQTKLQIW